MCVAIPSRVVESDGSTATVERFGEQLEVSLMLLAEPVAPGDFVIVQARAWAVEKIGPEEAELALALFREVFDASEPESGTPGAGGANA